VYEGEITENLLLMNLVICILKWVIWKTGNDIKYNKSTYREAIVITNLKNELRSNTDVNNLPLGAMKPQRFTNIYNEQ
jgi:hypothetical protein